MLIGHMHLPWVAGCGSQMLPFDHHCRMQFVLSIQKLADSDWPIALAFPIGVIEVVFVWKPAGRYHMSTMAVQLRVCPDSGGIWSCGSACSWCASCTELLFQVV